MSNPIKFVKMLLTFFKTHVFSTALKPHRTLRSLLVHPKDKLEASQKAQAIYEILCSDCDKSYIGETCHPFGVRLAEHQKEVQKLESLHYTRSTHKVSVSEQHKSAITDHVAATYHSINWEDAKVIDRESDKCTRWLKEANGFVGEGNRLSIRTRGPASYITSLINSSSPRPQREIL